MLLTNTCKDRLKIFPDDFRKFYLGIAVSLWRVEYNVQTWINIYRKQLSAPTNYHLVSPAKFLYLECKGFFFMKLIFFVIPTD